MAGRVPAEYPGAPPWPSLYWPFGEDFDPIEQFRDLSHTLYYIQDIWRFTVIWSLIFGLVVYIPAGMLALVTLAKSRTLRWYILLLIPFAFGVIGVLTTVITGSLLGVGMALVYSTGYFVMTTWIPFLWALINILVLIIGGYSTITAIL